MVNFPFKAKFKAKTKNQHEYLKCINESVVTLCHGPAGSGKTFIATAMALQSLTEGKVKQIIFTRPLIQCGDGLGYLKGSLSDKVDPYMMPLLEEANVLIGKPHVDSLIQQGIIRIIPLELMRGMNFHEAFMILDEASNADQGQIKMFLTRIGRDSKAVLVGDVYQTDLTNCHFSDVINTISRVDGVGVAELTKADIVRSDIVGRILQVL